MGMATQSSQGSLYDVLGLSRIANLSSRSIFILVVLGVCFLLVNLSFFRLAYVLSQSPPRRPYPSHRNTSHLMILLGSGGHTAEMLNILSSLPQLTTLFTKRTYIISSGDAFSALKAREFERVSKSSEADYNIETVRRARRVHQSLLRTPETALLCLWDCILLLQAQQPDLILTNGPGTGVCLVLASVILQFCGLLPNAPRSIFIESWARVKTLSLSGKILRPLASRFIVQWPELARVQNGGTKKTGGSLSGEVKDDSTGGNRVEYIGPLVH